MKRLGLSINDVNKMVSNSSAAIAAQNWQPVKRRRQARAGKEDTASLRHDLDHCQV